MGFTARNPWPCLKRTNRDIDRPPHAHAHTLLVRIQVPYDGPGCGTNRMPCLVRKVALGESLWGNSACLIEASSATSGDETRLNLSAVQYAVRSLQQRLGGQWKGWDSTRPGGYLGRRYRAGLEMARTDRSRSLQGPIVHLGIFLAVQMASDCPPMPLDGSSPRVAPDRQWLFSASKL